MKEFIQILNEPVNQVPIYILAPIVLSFWIIVFLEFKLFLWAMDKINKK